MYDNNGYDHLNIFLSCMTIDIKLTLPFILFIIYVIDNNNHEHFHNVTKL